MKLIALGSFAICAALALAPGSAGAAKKEKEKAAAPPRERIGSFGEWAVFHSGAGKGKICYVQGEPKSREPQDDKAQKAYAFISERPSEKVRNEVSFVMGFELAGPGDLKEMEKDKKKPRRGKKAEDEPAGPVAAVGDEAFDLIPHGNDLWVKLPAQEGKLIDVMRKGSSLVVKAPSKRGRTTTDTYSLSGFSQAVDKALKDCPAL